MTNTENLTICSKPGWVSRIFPGLWLDPVALLAGEGAKVMEKLQQGLRSNEHDLFVAELRKRCK